MIRVLPSTGTHLAARDARELHECLLAGGIAVIPTDTIYGLVCDPLQAAAVDRLYELKGRPPQRPSAVMFFTLQLALDALPELRERERAALRALLPGPLTVLLPNRQARYPLACPQPASRSSTAAPGSGTSSGALGLRVPLLPERLAALRAVGVPAMQSSANLSGGPEARRLADVPPAVLAGVDLVIDGGELPGTASTVLDLRDYASDRHWRVVREGPLVHDDLARALQGTADST